MTDTFALSARPPKAAIAWADKAWLYVEFPTAGAAPFVTRYPKTAAGLAQALNVLIEQPAASEPKALLRPAVKLTTFSASQRQSALAVLKRLKII